MDEPSVLDYVKSKLAFWKGSSIQIPIPEEETQILLPDEGIPLPVLPEMGGLADKKWPAEQPFSPAGLLLALASLALSLIAQSLIEPPNRAWQASLFVYGLAAAMLGTAFYRSLMIPADLPTEADHPDNLAFRLSGLIVGLVLMALTFLFFGRGAGDVPEFNLLNTVLWVLSIAYLVWSFWLPRQNSDGLGYRQRLARWLKKPSWNIQVTRWGLLILLAAGLILFFRFYRLQDVPSDMVSDHAEKLLDVSDVLNGETRVFFTRNTGREAFQFYWTALMVVLFNTGVTFMALKLGTVICGLITVFYMYRLGYEVGNRWVALFALLFTGFSYWANVQSRIGLRFPLYPFFFAPVLFHLLRGLRSRNRNDFILAGLWLGVGLHGYTSFRIVPVVVVVGIVIYLLHRRTRDAREFALWGLIIVVLVSLAVFMPLFRFTIDRPDLVAFRSLTRLGDLERPLPGPAWLIFLQNTWNALVMFFWDDGDVWVHSLVHRPALDVISAAVFFIGLMLVIMRYIRKRNWPDIFLLASIPLLLLPSILSLAFPNENPNLNRTAGAYVPVFLILAIGMEGLLSAIKRSLPPRLGTTAAWGLGLALVFFSALNNYDLLFVQYAESFRRNSWNTLEMGAVIRDFDHTLGRAEDAWVVSYPYWVDTRLVGINAGYPTRDTAIEITDLMIPRENPNAKLFLVNLQDTVGLAQLQALYPEGRYWLYPSQTPGKEFYVFQVPPQENLLPHGASSTP